MRILMLAASLSIGISACGDAQKSEAPDVQSMPMLSAVNTIEACLGRYPDLAARETECIGQYANTCMRLNTAYGAYMQRLEAPRDAGLREAQRAWMALRDADCDFAASAYEGGSMQPLVSAGCHRDYAARRTLLLLSWLEGPPY